MWASGMHCRRKSDIHLAKHTACWYVWQGLPRLGWGVSLFRGVEPTANRLLYIQAGCHCGEDYLSPEVLKSTVMKGLVMFQAGVQGSR